jgi:hypothetical protein
MATATKKARAIGLVPRVVGLAPESAAIELLVFQDNGGGYHWTIATASGEELARSPGFASYEDAWEAAGRVRDGVGSARLERQDVAVDSDVERWQDEGGAYSAAVAVAVELPPPR